MAANATKRILQPRLLVPRQKPTGHVRINWAHPLARGLVYCNIGGAIHRDLVGRGPVGSILNLRISKGNLITTSGGYMKIQEGYYDLQSVSKMTMVCRIRLSASGEASGFQLHQWGASNYKAGIELDASGDVRWRCDTNLSRVIVSSGALSGDTDWHTYGWRFDGTQATAANRLKGYFDRTEHTDTDSFPATTASGINRFNILGYSTASTTVGGASEGEFFFLWKGRTLTKKEYLSLEEDPYQFLETGYDRIYPVTDAITGISGSGSLSADDATISGTGVISRSGSGALTADDSTISGTGTVAGAGEVTGTGALNSQAAAISGTGTVLTTVTGTGALSAQSATISGTGSVPSAGGGDISPAEQRKQRLQWEAQMKKVKMIREDDEILVAVITRILEGE